MQEAVGHCTQTTHITSALTWLDIHTPQQHHGPVTFLPPGNMRQSRRRPHGARGGAVWVHARQHLLVSGTIVWIIHCILRCQFVQAAGANTSNLPSTPGAAGRSAGSNEQEHIWPHEQAVACFRCPNACCRMEVADVQIQLGQILEAGAGGSPLQCCCRETPWLIRVVGEDRIVEPEPASVTGGTQRISIVLLSNHGVGQAALGNHYLSDARHSGATRLA